jgi:hypothetical protein
VIGEQLAQDITYKGEVLWKIYPFKFLNPKLTLNLVASELKGGVEDKFVSIKIANIKTLFTSSNNSFSITLKDGSKYEFETPSANIWIENIKRCHTLLQEKWVVSLLSSYKSQNHCILCMNVIGGFVWTIDASLRITEWDMKNDQSGVLHQNRYQITPLRYTSISPQLLPNRSIPLQLFSGFASPNGFTTLYAVIGRGLLLFRAPQYIDDIEGIEYVSIPEIQSNIVAALHVEVTENEMEVWAAEKDGNLSIISLYSYQPPVLSHQLTSSLWEEHNRISCMKVIDSEVWCGTKTGMVFRINLLSKQVILESKFSEAHNMNISGIHVSSHDNSVITTSLDCTFSLWKSVLLPSVDMPLLLFSQQHAPAKSCVDVFLQDVVHIMKGLGDIERITNGSIATANRCLQSLPIDCIRLSEDEALAIALYTYDLQVFSKQDGMDNFYFILNQMLRKRTPSCMQKLQGYLYYLMNGMCKLGAYKGVVYRGIPGEYETLIKENYTVGKKIHWSSFTSTTTSLANAKMFGGYKGIIFEIEVESGRSVIHYSAFPTEDEVLLSPNFHMVVRESFVWREDEGYFYVYLKEVKDESYSF